MTDAKTIGISSLISLGVVLLAMVTPNFFDSPKYYCEARPELGVVSCDSFSKYVAENGKCVRDEDTDLICREGWMLVTNDIDIPSETDDSTTITKGVWGTSYKIKERTQPVIIED